MAYLNATELVQGTEREVFNFGAARDQDELDELDAQEEESDGDDSLEMIEGWNNDRIDADEMAHIAEHGFPDTNIDRPLALERDESHLRDVAALQSHIVDAHARIQELEARLDPDRQWRAEQQKAAEIEAFYQSPEGYLDARNSERAALQGRIQELEGSRVNASLAAAHREHGADFEAAYRQMTSMDPSHYAARALVQSIWNSDDPGRALMEFYDKTGGEPVPRAVGGQYSRGSNPPSLNSQSGGGRSGRSAQRAASRHSADFPFSEQSEDSISDFNPAVCNKIPLQYQWSGKRAKLLSFAH
jgi:hypothetical protein